MSLIPDEELRKASSLNLAPMVDFLFVIVAVFATLSITRTILYDTQVNLVKVTSEKKSISSEQPFVVNIGVTQQGTYRWITEMSEFAMENTDSIQRELQKQQQMGLISKNPEETKVLLHIDREAQWEPVSNLIFALREQGFPTHPVYEPE